MRPFEGGIIVMGHDTTRGMDVVRRVDPDTLTQVWELELDGVYDAILAPDGILYLSVANASGFGSRPLHRVAW